MVSNGRKYTKKSKARYRRRRYTFRPQGILKTGFPRTTMVKLRYVDSCDLDPGAGTVAQHVFSANSCFDPNVTGFGHQPMNFDEWSSLYNHYVVVGSKITATLHLGTGVGANGSLFGINLQDDTSVSTDPSTLMEQSLTKYKLANYANTQNSGNGSVVTKGFSCKRFFNIANPTDNITRVGAGIGSSPIEAANFIVFFGPPPGVVTDYTSVNATVVIDYIVMFSEPKGQSQS